MIENLADYKVLGNVSGGAAAPAEVAILDEDTMSSDSATSLITQQSAKAYVDTSITTAEAKNAWQFISSHDLTSEAYPYAITGLTGWDMLKFHLFLTGSADGDVYLQVGHGGTPTWLTGASSYRFLNHGQRVNSGDAVNNANNGDFAASVIDLCDNPIDVSANDPFVCELTFFNWTDTTKNRVCKYSSSYFEATTNDFETSTGAGSVLDTTNALTAIRFGSDGGGTFTGTILVEGRTFP